MSKLAMMKQAFEEILGDFYENGLPTDIKPRQISYLEKVHSVSVVTGMRRTGKTYFTYQRMKELLRHGLPLNRIVHVNFDDDRLKGATVADLRLLGDTHARLFPQAAGEKCWYFLDELQNVDGWEWYARRLLDSNLVQLCLTGSSSRLLSSEIATQMRGRALEIEMFPLSFAETLLFNGLFQKLPSAPYSARAAGLLRNAIGLYLETGGFPDVQGLPNRLRIKMLQEYVDAVVYRDILERHNIPSFQALRYTLRYLLHHYARKVSTRAIAGALKEQGLSSDRECIKNYLDYFRDAYLVYPVRLRTDSLTVQNANPDKYYFVDTGLIRAMMPKNDAERGWLLENLVFLALRRGLNKIEYYNVPGGGEVDFYVTDQITHEKRFVQVTWEMASPETRKRELDALINAIRTTGIQDATLVTWDDDESVKGNIRIVPVWKWTLEEAARQAEGTTSLYISPS